MPKHGSVLLYVHGNLKARALTVKFMYLVGYLLAYQVRVTVGVSGLCDCVHVTSFRR